MSHYVCRRRWCCGSIWMSRHGLRRRSPGAWSCHHGVIRGDSHLPAHAPQAPPLASACPAPRFSGGVRPGAVAALPACGPVGVHAGGPSRSVPVRSGLRGGLVPLRVGRLAFSLHVLYESERRDSNPRP